MLNMMWLEYGSIGWRKQGKGFKGLSEGEGQAMAWWPRYHALGEEEGTCIESRYQSSYEKSYCVEDQIISESDLNQWTELTRVAKRFKSQGQHVFVWRDETKIIANFYEVILKKRIIHVMVETPNYKRKWQLLMVDKYHFLTINIAWKRTKQ
jgi:hypothetical protein